MITAGVAAAVAALFSGGAHSQNSLLLNFKDVSDGGGALQCAIDGDVTVQADGRVSATCKGTRTTFVGDATGTNPDPATNHAPVANPIAKQTQIGTSVRIDIAHSSSVSDADGNLRASSVSVAPGCAECSAPANGSVVGNGAGTVTYTPAAGFSGNDSFGYQVCDTLAACASSSVVVQVSGEPTTPPPTASDHWGQDESGKWWSLKQETNGEVAGRLCHPSNTDCTTVIYDGNYGEIYYPSCAGKQLSPAKCGNSQSLEAGVLYVQRLRVPTTYPMSWTVIFNPTLTRDQLRTQADGDGYAVSISTDPVTDPEDGRCKTSPVGNKTFVLGPTGCPLFLNSAGPAWKPGTYYARFKAVGPDASRCGNGLICQNYIIAW
jgi:hypothetical protein